MAKLARENTARVLRVMRKFFAFAILDYCSNGCPEYISPDVATMLEKQRITSAGSRSQRCNDNTLIEGRGGTVTRCNFVYSDVPAVLASLFKNFCVERLIHS
ncbi:hypothetical protein WI84_18755 [Burkholderia ubonensis]|uniref:hypothetical protein n=1 Tax=Burkholderia ubonensis TaxID=101571 RepID=UPI000759D740|nr:hypothetical protein [Burkholderia ubonensis]KVD35033.1 hypothetical protein WI84_18755 [Burkholderia ubonensis]